MPASGSRRVARLATLVASIVLAATAAVADGPFDEGLLFEIRAEGVSEPSWLFGTRLARVGFVGSLASTIARPRLPTGA